MNHHAAPLLRALKGAFRRYRGLLRSPRQRRIQALIRVGDQARDRQDWAAAATSYAAVLAIDPRRAAIHVQSGHALKSLGDRDAAIAAYRRALQLAPQDLDVPIHLAHQLGLEGSHEEAVALLRDTLARAPSSTTGDLAPALAALRMVERMAFDAAWATAEASLAQGARHLAARQYHHALTRAPEDAVVLAWLADRLHATGAAEPALAACRRALRLHPAMPHAETVLALLERDSGAP